MANSLYPPIMDTYNPSFVAYKGTRVIENNVTYVVRKGYCNIYFYLSPYNNKADIKSIWISIVNSATNKTVLLKKTELYKTTVEHMHLDPTSSPENPRYYIRLGAVYLQGKTWDLNTIYKIQVRFCSKDFENTSKNVNANIDSFSEWSTATLVKPIPGYTTTMYKLGWNDTQKRYEFNSYQNLISGKVTYKDKYDVTNGEYLDSFQIKIYTASKSWTATDLVYDSGICYTDNLEPGVFQHKLTQGLTENASYIFQLSFTSNNLFKHTNNYKVYVKDREKGSLSAKITATPETENGRMRLTIQPPNREYKGNFLIRRSSSESNFTYWEDLKIIQLTDAHGMGKPHIEYDYTVDSGIYYQYYLTRTYQTKENKYASITEKPVLMVLEDIFINGNGRQLKIKFDPSISSYQHTISESSTQTIGGKYPFIKRNGNLNYRQIGISGLLSYQMDIEEGNDEFSDSQNKIHNAKTNGESVNLFTSKDKLYKGYTENYQQYNFDNRILPGKDFILERKFREEVENFLLDGEPKLFRSPTEKAGIVRLMNVSVSPNGGLGRMLYTFSATGHEIADCTLDNINKYSIVEKGGYARIQGSTLSAVSGRSLSMTGPVDYYEGIITNLVDALDASKFTLSVSSGKQNNYESVISHFENTTIRFFDNSAHTINASPYKINGSDSLEPIVATGEDLTDENNIDGFILYYEQYDPNMNTTIQSLVLQPNANGEASYTFSSDMPLTYLSYAVPQDRTIYATVSAVVKGYEILKDEADIGES